MINEDQRSSFGGGIKITCDLIVDLEIRMFIATHFTYQFSGIGITLLNEKTSVWRREVIYSRSQNQNQ